MGDVGEAGCSWKMALGCWAWVIVVMLVGRGRGEGAALIVEASPSSLTEMVGTEMELVDLACEVVVDVEAAAVMEAAGARVAGEAVSF